MDTEILQHASWLDKDFVQTIIRNKENSPEIVVTDLDVRAAVGKGDNYASLLLRLTVHLQDGATTEKRHFVVKTFPVAEMLQKLLDRCGTFEREIHMYQVTLPSMNRILANVGLPPLCAASYPTTRPRTIFIHDLTSEGFKMADRHNGLDLAQCSLALRMLARFHASALLLRQTDASAMDMYEENYYCEENRDILASLMEPMFKALVSQVSTWPGYEHFADKLERTLTISNAIALMKPKENETLILNHGDTWVNNLLFKFSSLGDVIDMRFIDFQEMRLVSPVIDLQYFLNTSPSDLVREQHWDRLFEVYHKEFRDVLTKQGVHNEDIPNDLATVDALVEKFNEKNFIGLWISASIFPIVSAESNVAPDFEKWEESDGNSAMFMSTRFINVFKKLLHQFEKRGVFDLHVAN